MGFRVKSDLLFEEVKRLNAVISGRTTPILDNLFFDVGGNVLKLRASDLEHDVESVVVVESDSDESYCISSQFLHDTLKTFRLGEELFFERDLELNQLKVSSDYGAYFLPYLSGEDFPDFKDIEGDVSSIVLGTDIVREAISNTDYALSSDIMVKALTGVYFNFLGDRLEVVGSDGRLLSCYRVSLSDSLVGSFILSKKAAGLLKSLLVMGEDVSLLFSEDRAVFRCDHRVISSQLIPHKFPDYARIFPKDSFNVLRIDRKRFLGIIRRISNFSDKFTYTLRLNLSKDRLAISASNFEYKFKSEEVYEVDYAGDSLDFSLNSRDFLTILSKSPAKELEIRLQSEDKPGLVLSRGPDNSYDLLSLLLPVV